MSRREESDMRRRPRQSRSRDLVEAILVATERVIAAHGIEGATTNRIAEVAGVSIGSLYQYFPNKDALVALARERSAGRFQADVDPEVEKLLELPLEAAVRGLVGLLIERHREELALHNALVETPDTLHDALQERWAGVVEAYLAAHRAEIRPTNLALAARIGLEVIESLTHGVALRDPALLEDPEFAEELCALLLGYLRRSPGSGVASVHPERG